MTYALAQSLRLLQSVIDNAPVRIFWKDINSCYLGCNPAFARDAGFTSPEQIIGKYDSELCWYAQANAYRLDDLDVINTQQTKLNYEEKQTTPDGSQIWLRTSKVPLLNEHGEAIGMLGIYDDITQQKNAEQHIYYLANFDPLTGLPNRAQLNEHLKQALSLAKRSNGHVALLFLDLDHFKDINDTLGHSTGDTVLVEVAHRLRSQMREEDIVTRMGGDEFIFLLPGTDAKHATYIAQKLLELIAIPYHIPPYELILSASIGIAIYPEDGFDLETLSQSADTAMYQAKREGRQGYRFFTPEMQARSTKNLQLLNALRHAQELNQLKVYYQPQLDIETGQIIGAEALLRWQHPILGMVPPNEFIPVAEDSGLIIAIGEWVLRTAVKQTAKWVELGQTGFIIAVNLSAVQFRHPDLATIITGILHAEGLNPNNLELELTESTAMQNPQSAISTMRSLTQQGIRVAIDDFGTGYSSLSYLKKLDAYKLKIDQSFVRDILTDPDDKAIVTAIIGLAKSLGRQTIAEGVETLEQKEFLQQQGCAQFQGYLFSKPILAEQFEALLIKQLN